MYTNYKFSQCNSVATRVLELYVTFKFSKDNKVSESSSWFNLTKLVIRVSKTFWKTVKITGLPPDGLTTMSAGNCFLQSANLILLPHWSHRAVLLAVV